MRAKQKQDAIRDDDHGKTANDVLNCRFERTSPLSRVATKEKAEKEWGKGARDAGSDYGDELCHKNCKCERHIHPTTHEGQGPKHNSHADTKTCCGSNFVPKPGHKLGRCDMRV